MLKKFLRILLNNLDSFLKFKRVYAHCDIPCGIYDPYVAQIAAHTVLRMTSLLHELGPDSSLDKVHKIQRYTAVKERHAELVKEEIRILWGDYFKTEHLEKYPQLHQLVFDIMKLASKTKQEANLEAAKELLAKVQELANIFYETKGVKPIRVKSIYPTQGEVVFYQW